MHKPTASSARSATPDSVWHTLTIAAVARELGVDPAGGLSPQQAAQRLRDQGPNLIPEAPPRPAWRLLLDQFSDFMILALLAAALFSGLIGDLKDSLAIIVIVVLNAAIGFVQELRARRAMAALRQMAAQGALVVRAGARQQIAAGQLVPGDVVLLEAGNIVPADLRLTEAVRLQCDESMLTGESAASDKQCEPLAGIALALGDRNNLAYKGSVVSAGRGTGIVVATGVASQLGQIARLLESGSELKTPLQQRLGAFGRRLALAVLAICAFILLIGLLRGEAPLTMLLTVVSLAVAAIPEALPAVVTIALALGARQMVGQHALIRRLPAVETLGSVSYICSDKTGTLTQNKMRVQEIAAAGISIDDAVKAPPQEPWRSLLSALALCNDTRPDRHGKPVGEATELALYQAALAAGYDKNVLERGAARVLELPFDSRRKCMTTVHSNGSNLVAYSKGAPESLLACCSRAYGADGETDLRSEAILAQAQSMAAAGLRVLAVARREWASLPIDSAALESGLTFLGLVGLLDPPRHEARNAVHLCQSAGITPVMITGDHAATALAIALRLGIARAGDRVLSGTALAALDDDEFRRQAAQIRVYARVDPAQKIRIVAALQAQGEFVAMTGDGVNDAPALQRADIGIAMGLSGSDVAREASSMVLLDDNFASIVHAVRTGRRIYDNIRKFIRYAMTGNSAEIWVIFLAPLLGLPMPLLPIHILWINLLTDGLPGLALAAEAAEKDVMQRPPRPPRESIFAHGMWQHIVWVGLCMAGVTLAVQAWAVGSGSPHWQSMVFTVLTLAQLGHVLAIRSERESLFRLGLLSNLPLLGAVLLSLLLQLAVLYLPFLNPVFNTSPLSAAELAICLALAGVVFLIVEIEKLAIRRGWLYRRPAGQSDEKN